MMDPSGPSPFRAALAAETARALVVIDPELRRALFEETEARMPRVEASVPVPHGTYVYSARRDPSRRHPVFCRRPLDGRKPTIDQIDEEVLLDVDELADGAAYCEVRTLRVSPDHRRLAYALDRRGDERCEVWVRHLDAPERPDTLVGRDRGTSLAWSSDGAHLFTVRLDAAHRGHQVWRSAIDRRTQELVHEERDEAFRLRVATTESGAFILLVAQSLETTELLFLSTASPLEIPHMLCPRRPSRRLAATHHGDFFYLLTNGEAPSFELARVPISAPTASSWQTVLEAKDNVDLERIQAFAEHLVIWERLDGRQRLRVRDQITEEMVLVEPPEATSVLHPGDNREYTATTLRLGYSSLTTPFSVLELDLVRHEWTVRKRTEVADFDPADYVCRRTTALSEDGTEIPISMVYRDDLRDVGGNPLLLYGYGAYGHRLDGSFDAARLALLDRGVIFAVAHVRGGGERGERWHRAARGATKMRSIRDFIACAEHLVASGWAAPGRLAAQGESAGGLLVAAAMNQRPDLFAAVIADCPFVDVVGSLLDPSLPLTVSDWDEWGDPREPEARAIIASYSPIENLEPLAYPAVLATAGLHDPWVPASQVLDWVRRLRAVSTSGRPIHLVVDLESGHRGPSDRAAFLRQTALEQAFLLLELGVSRQLPEPRPV
ncbi:MAG: prolyl oligopeptidase family serine peptidase [Acidobacteriota bacterium]